MRYLIILPFMFFLGHLAGQPFIDLVNIRYIKSPDAGIIRRDKQHNHFDYLNISLNIPIVFKKDSSVIVFSPFGEQWYLQLNNVSYLPDHFQSISLPVSYIKPLSEKWTITVNLIPRWNGNSDKWFDNNFQAGGAILATHNKNQRIKYKFGIYYNREFSGPFIMPLLGLDWKVDARNNIFGILPGNMVWEHKARKNFYYGTVFRAVTNSYLTGQLNSKDYFARVDDNQLSLYADLYVSKRIVFNIEAGHSVLRQVRLGFRNGAAKYFYKEKSNDDLMFKASLAYRLRL